MGGAVDALREVELFRDLGAGDLERIREPMRERVVPAGSDLITQGEPGDVFFAVLDGSLKVYRRRRDGGEVILAIVGPGEIVGELPADARAHTNGVAALDETRVLSLAGGSFRRLVDEIPALRAGLVNLLSERLRVADSRIESLAGQDVEGRVACVLLELARQHGTPKPGGGTLITIPLTQAEVAAMTGASRVRVNQVIAKFRRQGWVTLDGRRRTSVQDPAALESCCR
jgi:CRP/FNR family transcriptional regulator